YGAKRTYSAIRVPQVEGNTEFRKKILAGLVDQRAARTWEKRCLQLLEAYDRQKASLRTVVEALDHYEEIFAGRISRSTSNRETLEARPWTDCGCAICKAIGIHVVIFRGAERNRRRGFHNLYMFSERLRKQRTPIMLSDAKTKGTR